MRRRINLAVGELTFNTIESLVNADFMEKLNPIIMNIMDRPWLVDELLYEISDQNKNLTLYERETVKKICELLIQYFSASWMPYFDISSGSVKIQDIIKYDKQTRYCITAAGGYRVATAKEVSNGYVKDIDGEIVSIVDDPSVKLDESQRIFINLFTWSTSGLWRYYIAAGYECKYNKNGQLEGAPIKYIMKIYDVLIRMCERLSEGFYDEVIDNLKNIKKLGQYRYPEYASDEMDISTLEPITFVVNQLEKNRYKFKENIMYRCLRVIKNSKNGRYSVEDMVLLRTGYIELKRYLDGNSKSINNDQENTEIRELCDRIRLGVADGYIGLNEFATKVVGTISKSNYSRMSEKQRAILVEACDKIERARIEREKEESAKLARESSIKKDNEPSKEIDLSIANDFGLASLSDLLGSGAL